MSDFGDTTGMQNPIFKIMNSQATGQNQQGMGQNPMNLNPNSMAPNQMGMSNSMNPQQGMMGMGGTQNMMGNNPMGNNPMGNNPMGGMQQQTQNMMGNNPMGNNPMGNNQDNSMNQSGMQGQMNMNPFRTNEYESFQ